MSSANKAFFDAECFITSYAGSSIMRVTYGIDVDDAKEDYLGIAEAAMALLSSTLAPGRHLVETFPSLRFLPSWVPGAREFRRDAERLMHASRAMRDVPWGAALAGMVGAQQRLRALFGVLTRGSSTGLTHG